MAGQLQNFTVDQLAGAVALSLGALGSLLLVIWQSKCRCACRIGISDQCYLFDCSREPPPIDIERRARDCLGKTSQCSRSGRDARDRGLAWKLYLL